MPYWLDGNNLIGQPARKAQEDPRTRAEFLSLLSNIASSRGGRFLVFFDGDDPDRRMPPRAVQVRYSAPLSADEAILNRLRELQTPSEVTVVSNDGELKARCQNAGARTLTWREFSEKVKPSLKLGNRGPAREEPVRVKEWMDYFGLTEENLE